MAAATSCKKKRTWSVFEENKPCDNQKTTLSTLRRGNFKTQQSPVIFYFCLSKTRSGRLHDYCHTIVFFEKLRFQSVFRSNENESQEFLLFEDFKGVFEELRFRDGLEWMVSLTLEITLFITEVCVFDFL